MRAAVLERGPTLPDVFQSNDPPPVRRAVVALLLGAVMGAAVAAVVPREVGAPQRGRAAGSAGA